MARMVSRSLLVNVPPIIGRQQFVRNHSALTMGSNNETIAKGFRSKPKRPGLLRQIQICLCLVSPAFHHEDQTLPYFRDIRNMDVLVVIAAQSEFALDFHKQLVRRNENAAEVGNSILSPISVATAVAMAGVGAKGKTLEEIQSVLKLPEGEEMHKFASHLKSAILKDASGGGGPSLSFANGLWVDASLSLKEEFKTSVVQSYGAEARTADFGAKADEERLIINKWVSDQTLGKVENLLPSGSVNPVTVMVLANALYFKGTWSQQFDPEETKDDLFHLLDGTSVNVPFMTSTRKQVISEFDTYKILKLLYVRGDDNRAFSMYFFLPNENKGLAELENQMDAETLTQRLQSTRRARKVGEFRLPKFKISAGFEASDVLKSLGLSTPFSPAADFTNMSEDPQANLLSLSNVFHKCFIEVNEEGTEAAAASAATMVRGLPLPEEPIDFIADHPFLFVLKEDVTGLILFIGRITNPSVQK